MHHASLDVTIQGKNLTDSIRAITTISVGDV